MTTDHEIAPKELEAAIQAHIQTCRLGAGVENREETVRAVITAYLNARGSRPDRASYNAGFEFGIQVSTVFQEEVAERLGCDVESVTVENVVALVEAARDASNWLPGCCPDSDMKALETTVAPFAKKGG